LVAWKREEEEAYFGAATTAAGGKEGIEELAHELYEASARWKTGRVLPMRVTRRLIEFVY
jgi:hypothetical protein